MDQDQKIVVSDLDVRAARKEANRLLASSSLGEQQDVLLDFVSFAIATNRSGLPYSSSLEVSSGLLHEDANPVSAPGLLSLEEIVSFVETSSVSAKSVLSYVHNELISSQDPPPTVFIAGRLYRRKKQDVSLPIVIGLNEQLREVSWSVDQLFLYDPLTQENLFSHAMYEGILLYGPPGTGKSSLCNYAITYAKSLSQQTGIPFRFSQFSAADYSKWVGESAQNFLQRANTVSSLDGVGICVIDDIDMVVQSREDPSSSHGGLQVTSQIMQVLSGLQDFSGNALYLATTNALSTIDPALRRRFGLQLEVPLFSSLDQYSSFIQYKANKFSSYMQEYLSSFCFEQKFSPAQMMHLLKRVYRCAYGEISSDVLSLSSKDRNNLLLDRMRELSINDVQRLVGVGTTVQYMQAV